MRTRIGWCPSVATPMAAEDGLLVRVKPPAATIPAIAARALGDAADAFGNGVIELTMRGNLQFRGLTGATAERFREAALAHGMVHPAARVEVVRNVSADPLGPDDPAVDVDSHALARAIEAMIATHARLHDLPPKFGFAVDAGVSIPLGEAGADICLRADGDATAIWPAGARIAARATRPAEAARQLALVFLELRGRHGPPVHRMRELVARAGEADLFAATGLSPDMPVPTVGGAPRTGCVPTGETVAVFARATGMRVHGATLRRLGDLAERYGDVTVRMTPWRGVVLPGISAGDMDALSRALEEQGLDVRTGTASAGNAAA